jgi:hypothetical protein
VVFQPRHPDMTRPGFKWDCAYGFQRQCYPLLAAWVGDYPEQVIVPQVTYGSCPMCEIPQGVPIGDSTFRPLDSLRDEHIHSELLADNNLEALQTVGIHRIRNHFWEYSLSNVYWLWQPDEFPPLLLGLVRDSLPWLLQYPKAGNVKDQFRNRFTSMP